MVTAYGKYVLLKRLAVGGMAEIFLARQSGAQGFQKLVVVKRILQQYATSPEFVEMFLDEGRLAAALSHPNIVQIYDLGEADDTYFIAMEFVPGHDLSTLIKKVRATQQLVPIEVAAKIIAGAAEGLHHAHVARNYRGKPMGLIHRDVSPSNLLVSYDGAVKVVDFGIAKAESQSSKTQAGTVKGKFSYMSPEQIVGQPLDGRSDIFALGICLYETLTARRLFRRENELAIVNAIVHGEIQPPSELREDIPAELNAICMKALEKDRSKRYQTAQELAADLERFIASRCDPISVLRTFIASLFSEEAATYQKLLEELPTGTPEDLAEVVRHTRERSASGPSLDQRPAEEEIEISAVVVAPDRSSGKLGLIAALLLLAAGGGVAWHFLQPKPESPPVAAAVPSPTTGELTIETQPPGATITLNGEPTGKTTPASFPALAFGVEHRVKLELEGHEPLETTASLTAQRSNRSLSINLQAISRPAPVEVPPAEPPVVAREERSARPRRNAPPPKPQFGTLELSSSPEADVTFEGKSLGRTPLKAKLPAGKVRLSFVNSKEGLNQTLTLEVPENGSTSNKLTFRKGKLLIDAVPWAHVYLGNEKLGTTPVAAFEVYEGVHTVRLVNSDLGVVKTTRVEVAPGKTSVVRQQM